ncbi:MAG: helix-turn-helix domain-containing protein [Spirochaetaceae bacterium]|jgi:transposase|nr:helix-turn-helix domain-containing protein [Spirochaetaceae bacterium]
MKREVLPQLNAEDKDLMEHILAAGKIKHKFAVRLQTVLHRANGKGTNEIAEFLGIHPMTVSLYVRRYTTGGIDALIRDKTRKPGKAPISEEKKQEICRIACQEKPPDETHWSTRKLGKRVGIGHDAVKRYSGGDYCFKPGSERGRGGGPVIGAGLRRTALTLSPGKSTAARLGFTPLMKETAP